jgi:hypothetical protein
MARTLAKIGTLALGFGFAGSIGSAEGTYRGYETPPYTVETRIGGAEVRAYAPYLVAEVTVAGDRDAALSRGFSILARYIFGGNEDAAQVSMTTPVAQRPASQIAMTAPVAQRGSGETWTVSFMMPSSHSRDTLPRPENDAIRLVETAPERQIVLRFPGRGTEAQMQAKAADLRGLAEGAGLAIAEGPFFYFYDDPFTLPWNRRNEVAFRLQ